MGPWQSVMLLQIVADKGRFVMHSLSVGGVYGCDVHTHKSAYSISMLSDRNKALDRTCGMGRYWGFMVKKGP